MRMLTYDFNVNVGNFLLVAQCSFANVLSSIGLRCLGNSKYALPLVRFSILFVFNYMVDLPRNRL